MTERPLVLIVNDDIHWLQGAQDILAMAGFRVVTAGDGLEALERVAQYALNLQLILMNWMMPRKSGLDVIRELRLSGINLPIIMISAHPDSMAPEALAAGADQYLRLPVDSDTLLAAMRTYVDPNAKPLP